MSLIRTLRRVLAGVLGLVSSLLGRVTGLLDRLTRLLRPGGGSDGSDSDERGRSQGSSDDADDEEGAREEDTREEAAAQADDSDEDREDEAAQADGAGEENGRDPATAGGQRTRGDTASRNGSGASDGDRRLASRRRRDMIRRLQRLSDQDLAQLYAVEARTRDREEVLSALRQAMARRRVR